jgi:hypothetical protein
MKMKIIDIPGRVITIPVSIPEASGSAAGLTAGFDLVSFVPPG